MIAANNTERRVDLVIAAKDEASAMMRIVTGNLREFDAQGRSMFRETDKSLNDFSGHVHSFFEEMKSNLGRGSTLFEAAHLFEFGGAAIGLRVIGHEFEEVVESARKALVETDRFSESGQRVEQSWGFLSPGNTLVEGLQDIYAWTLKAAGADEEMIARTESAATVNLRLAEALKEREQAEKDLANRDKQVDEIVQPVHRAVEVAGKSAFDKERAEALDNYQKSLAKVDELEKLRNENYKKMSALGGFRIGETSQTTDERNKYKAEDQRIIAEENSLPAQAQTAYNDTLKEISDKEKKQQQEDSQRKAESDRRKQDAKERNEDELESARVAVQAANLRADGHKAEAEALERKDHLRKDVLGYKQKEREELAGAGDDPKEKDRIRYQETEREILAKQQVAAEEREAQSETRNSLIEGARKAADKAIEFAKQVAEKFKQSAIYTVELAKWREENVTKVQDNAAIERMRSMGKETEAMKAEEANRLKEQTEKIRNDQQRQIAEHPEMAAQINRNAADAVAAAKSQSKTELAAKLASRAKEFKVSQSTEFSGETHLGAGFRGTGGGNTVSADPHLQKLNEVHQSIKDQTNATKELVDLFHTVVQLLQHGGGNAIKLLRAP